MAFRLSGPLRLLGYKDGKPVFDLPTSPVAQTATPAPAPVAAPAAVTSAATAPKAQSAAPAGARPNKFPGTCVLCREAVPEQKGLLAKQDGEWRVWHQPGNCSEKKAAPVAAPVAAPRRAAPPAAPARGPVCTPDGKEPSKGYFTAEFAEDGKDTYVTLRLRRQAAGDSFKPGRMLVSYLSGPSNESDYTRFADIDAQGRCWIWPKYRDNARLRRAVAAVLGDQKAAGEAWARESQSCWRCGLALTTPWALDHLMGKDCWEQYTGG